MSPTILPFLARLSFGDFQGRCGEGTTTATGWPRFVMVTDSLLACTSSRTDRHLALNSVALITRCFIVFLW